MRTKEEIRAYNKAFYAKNRERLLSRAKDWKKENPEKWREYMQQWRKKNRARHLELCRSWYHKNYTSRTYGVTREWYGETLTAQNNACAICGCPPTKRKFVVDHDHETGKVRGLLCDPCNTSLNRLETVHNWTDKAASYLQKHK